MRYVIAAAAAVFALAGCASTASHPSGNPAACKQAMRQAYASAVAAGSSATPAAEPAACHGVPAATVERFAAQIMAGR